MYTFHPHLRSRALHCRLWAVQKRNTPCRRPCRSTINDSLQPSLASLGYEFSGEQIRQLSHVKRARTAVREQLQATASRGNGRRAQRLSPTIAHFSPPVLPHSVRRVPSRSHSIPISMRTDVRQRTMDAMRPSKTSTKSHRAYVRERCDRPTAADRGSTRTSSGLLCDRLTLKSDWTPTVPFEKAGAIGPPGVR
jgi:hypothetical protein